MRAAVVPANERMGSQDRLLGTSPRGPTLAPSCASSWPRSNAARRDAKRSQRGMRTFETGNRPGMRSSRHDDGRSLLRVVYGAEVDIAPDLQAKTLAVRLHPLANPSLMWRSDISVPRSTPPRRFFPAPIFACSTNSSQHKALEIPTRSGDLNWHQGHPKERGRIVPQRKIGEQRGAALADSWRCARAYGFRDADRRRTMFGSSAIMRKRSLGTTMFARGA
jgi:hypothetical protein